MKTAKGTIQTTFWTIIPILLKISRSRITNGSFVPNADQEHATGFVFFIHITPFIAIGLVIPVFFKKPIEIKENRHSL